MKSFKWIVFVLLVSSLSVFSQDKYIRHTVSKGETVSEIAKKYKVTSSVIFELNPDAVNGIKQKTVLLIPTSKAKITKNSTSEVAKAHPTKNHEVLPKETVYGIAKQLKINVAELYSINPDLEKEGLKIGQTIKVPQTTADNLVEMPSAQKDVETSQPKESETNISKEKDVRAANENDKGEVQNFDITHEVLPKESWYSISRKYGITVAALQKNNPSIEKSSLKTGQKIIIPSKSGASFTQPIVIAEEIKQAKSEKVLTNNEQPKQVDVPSNQVPVVDNVNSGATISRVVLPKESLYSIAKLYGITVAEIKNANPGLGTKSLKAGQKITIPVENNSNSSLTKENVPENKEEIKIKASTEVVEKSKEVPVNKTKTVITHEVLPKETKYGIAKQYGLTVAELEKQNPTIANKLLVGVLLEIQTNKQVEKPVPTEVVVVDKNRIEENSNSNPMVMRDSAFVDQLISKASENIGTRYRSGGTTTEGFDCSGLMCYTFANSDIKLPRSSAEMAAYGSKIEIENAQKGDLIFFKTRGSGRINHVGMVVEVFEGEIKFIHSATHGGVMISSTKESYYERNLVQVNRVL